MSLIFPQYEENIPHHKLFCLLSDTLEARDIKILKHILSELIKIQHFNRLQKKVFYVWMLEFKRVCHYYVKFLR